MVTDLITIFENNILLALLILLVIIPLYYKLGLLYWLTGKNGEKSNKDLSSQMTELTAHFNHETTDLLTEIKSELKIANVKLDKVYQQNHEIINYGVKLRNGKTNY